MKKLLASAAVALGTLAFAPAQAQTGHVYLGGALSLAHCSQIAGAAGYGLAHFGGFVNGVYVVNACFGSQPTGGGGGGQTRLRNYDVYAYGDVYSCKEDIEWALRDVRCRVRTDYLECTSRAGDLRRDIESVSCVRRAYETR